MEMSTIPHGSATGVDPSMVYQLALKGTDEALKGKTEDEVEMEKLARQDPNKFAYFRFLPTELRMKIWALARPEGRYILLKISQKGGNAAPIYSPAKVPSLLHACYESRLVARGWYRLAFATITGGEMRTYFDPTRDGIYAQCYLRTDCGAHNVGRVMTAEGLQMVKRMVWEGPFSCPPFASLAKFGRIKDVILVKGRRTAPRSEVTIAEMTLSSDQFRGLDDDTSWTTPRDIMAVIFGILHPHIMVQNMMAIESITCMNLAELTPYTEDKNCPCDR